MIGQNPANVVSIEQFKRFLELKRAATRALCDALYDYLTVELDVSAAAPQVQQHQSTLEDLNKAQQAVEDLEAQIAATENAMAAMPDEHKPLAGAMLPMLRSQLRSTIEWRDMVQRTIEDEAQEEAGE